MFGLDPLGSNLVGGGLMTVIGFIVVRWLAGMGKKIDGRQLDLMELSNETAKAGFTLFPELLNRLAVGDYRGAFQQARSIRTMMTDQTQREAHFDAIFAAQLPAMMASPARRQKLIEAYEGINPGITAEARALLDARAAADDRAAAEARVAAMAAPLVQPVADVAGPMAVLDAHAAQLANRLDAAALAAVAPPVQLRDNMAAAESKWPACRQAQLPHPKRPGPARSAA